MKAKLCLFIVSAVLLSSCAKRKFVKEITGTWVPTEIVYTDGIVSSGPQSARSIFGVYAESVRFSADKTYIPVQWQDGDNFTLKSGEAGRYEYTPKTKRLSLSGGVWGMKFTVEKLDAGNLWLKLEDSYIQLIKMKRETGG